MAATIAFKAATPMEIAPCESNEKNVKGYFTINKIKKGTSSVDAPYLMGDLKQGEEGETIHAVKWDYEGELTGSDNGSMVYVTGSMEEYNDAPQIRLTSIRSAETYAPTETEAGTGTNENITYIRECLNSIRNNDIRDLVLYIYFTVIDLLRTIPAAKKHHHAFLGGLAMHTADVMRRAEANADINSRLSSGKKMLHRDLLIAGAFLHDIGKIEEFQLDEEGLVSRYSMKGKLLGHSVIGAMKIHDAGQKLGTPEHIQLLLMHMVISHHGKKEYGAAVTPQFADAELLSELDSMSCRMEVFREEYEELKPGCTEGYNRTLGRSVMLLEPGDELN